MQSYDSNCALDCSIWMAPNEKMSGEKRAVSSLPDRLCWTEVCSQIRLFLMVKSWNSCGSSLPLVLLQHRAQLRMQWQKRFSTRDSLFSCGNTITDSYQWNQIVDRISGPARRYPPLMQMALREGSPNWKSPQFHLAVTFSCMWLVNNSSD